MDSITFSDKIMFLRNVIEKIFYTIEKYKIYDIIEINDYNQCLEHINNISNDITEMKYNKSESMTYKGIFKELTSRILGIVKKNGTNHLTDLLVIVGISDTSKILHSETERAKYEVLSHYFHPIGFKYISKNENDDKYESINSNTEHKNSMINIKNDMINLQCEQISSKYSFILNLYGIKVYIHQPKSNKYLVVYGYVDNILLSLMTSNYVKNRLNDIAEENNTLMLNNTTFGNYLKTLSIRDILMFDNLEICNNFKRCVKDMKQIAQKSISQNIKEFVALPVLSKRSMLINLLIHEQENNNQYLAYLLYDLLSCENTTDVDTKEQMDIYKSFPFIIKEKFKQAMQNTIIYTKQLSHYDANKIPLEQQICLMNTSDVVKEKAFMKLKEIKTKSEDSGSKARQYLDGLLKIPFGIYKKEPIFEVMNGINERFNYICKLKLLKDNEEFKIPSKSKYTIFEIKQILKFVNIEKINYQELNQIVDNLYHVSRKELIHIVDKMNNTIENYNGLHNNSIITIYHKSKPKQNIIEQIINYIEICKNDTYLLDKTLLDFKSYSIGNECKYIYQNIDNINNYMKNITSILDNSVYGHNHAKKQIEKIIAQWINGSLDGYCFGFEGPPGVGKTSLAKKGLSNCLKDVNSTSRPFSMIQMGGDSNGSTIHGHNYTYVGSTWGAVVQILMDSKCMNPIIFIDEVDKISNTEHGREIVGILTHLLDSTQNDNFQDKYFNGINIDLSKAFFILSYNDVSKVDRVLLDRIHRIKFENLSLKDKIVICQEYLLPELYSKMGLVNVIDFSESTLEFVIENYTCESGVRKLKEKLFDIIGEINLNIITDNINFEEQKNEEGLISISEYDIEHIYLKNIHKNIEKTIHSTNTIGVINGLWANALGQGGIIPIQSKWKPSSTFLSLSLTGTQGDVMKESMNVALTLAWGLLLPDEIIKIKDKYSGTVNNCGVHIHCPDTSTPKDGPSAGTAITVVLYSLFTNKPIKNNIAITGEICLSGAVTAIGGLELKILGAIKAGVDTILFPHDNLKDYNKFLNKYKNDTKLSNISCVSIKTIYDAIKYVF